jgi:hypothetical protein
LRHGNRRRAQASLRFDVGRPDDRAPLLDFFGAVLSEIGGRAPKDHPAQLGKASLDLGVAKSSVDLRVELVDDLNGRALRCCNAIPRASKPGSNSPKAGISGKASERVVVVTASGRSLPDLMCPIDAGKLSNGTRTTRWRRSACSSW